MKKISIVLIMFIFFTLISGCAPQSSQADETTLKVIEKQAGQFLAGASQQQASEANADPQDQTNSAVFPETFVVSESGTIPGWKKLEAREPLYQFEAGDQRMSWRSLPEKDMVDYVIHYPGEWTFDGFGVFCDSANNKVAELAPVARDGMDIINEIFRDYQPPETYEKEPILKELVAFNQFQGLRLIAKVPLMDGQRPYWYSHMYLLSNGNHLFTIIFYTYELTEPDQELFDKIAGTLRFK
jgi:hypothetical protein